MLRRAKAQRGLSLLELIISSAIIATMAGVGMPRRETGLFALRTAQTTFVADMRMARGSAVGRGTHYRLDITDTDTYDVLRMQEVGGLWVPDGAPEITRTLPSHVSFSGGVGNGYEFNTRGLMVEPTIPDTLTLVDSSSGGSRTVDVWPSGQVVPGDAL
jgi:prepilin-type N-terminal cleavage/methylation domain-containing protein